MQETFPGLYDDWDYCIGTLSYVILYSGGESAKSNEFLNFLNKFVMLVQCLFVNI
jgi:hypothetical protein